MLTSFAQQLARAKRQKELLLCCRTAHLDIIFAALRGAEAKKMPLLISLDITQPLLFSPESLLLATLAAAQECEMPVSVEVICEPTPGVITKMLEKGAQAIGLEIPFKNQEEILELAAEACKAAGAFGADLILSLPPQIPLHSVHELVERTGAHAVRVTVHREREAGKVNGLAEDVADMVQAARVPVLAEEAHFASRELEALRSAGISAVTLGKTLEESFTAGLRTSLRDRSHSQPSKYLQLSMRATEETVVSYLQHLATHS